MASAEFSDERRLSNPDLSDDRRKSSVRRLSVNEPGKKNVKRGFQAGLTAEMEDDHVDLSVTLCRGASTPSTRLVSISP